MYVYKRTYTLSFKKAKATYLQLPSACLVRPLLTLLTGDPLIQYAAKLV